MNCRILPKTLRKILAATFTLSALSIGLSACVAVAPRTKVNIGYYDVAGNSLADLDRQISLHGPKVPGVGEAIASTRLKMIPDIHMTEYGMQCRVSRANIRVEADVTLPRLRQNDNAKLTKAFRNLENYARLHEAVHVSIAEKYARRAEKELLQLPPSDNCQLLQKTIVERYNKLFELQEKEQQKFDRDESRRLSAG